MRSTFLIAFTALVMASGWVAESSALEFCSDTKACASGTTCLGSFCFPDAMICTSDAGCAAYEKCDFTCPYGVATSVSGGGSTGATEVPPTDPEEGSGSSGSSDSPAPPPGDDDQGEKVPEQGGGKDAPPVQSTCPKDKGMCVVVLDKVPADASCKSFCEVIGPCGFSGGGSSSNGSSGVEPAPQPLPAPGGEPDESQPKGGSDDDDEGDSPSASGEKVPVDGDAGESSEAEMKQSIETCVTICSVWKLKAVAVSELNALQVCVANNSSKTCDELSKSCDAEGDAWEKAMKANKTWQLGLGGGWGASSSLDTTTPMQGGTEANGGEANGSGSKAGGSSDVASAAEGSPSASAGSGSAGGCVASPVAPSHGGAALLIALLFGALLVRRRMRV